MHIMYLTILHMDIPKASHKPGCFGNESFYPEKMHDPYAAATRVGRNTHAYEKKNR